MTVTFQAAATKLPTGAVKTFDELLAARRVFAPLAQDVVDLALLALKDRREPEALATVAATADRIGNDATLWHVLGLLHRALGDLEPALGAFDKGLALTPNNARLAHARARATQEAGLDSLEWYARARQLAPSDGDVLLGEAAALSSGGQGAAADTLLATLLRQHPGWLPGHSAIAQLRFASGRADWLELLDEAIVGAPRDVRLHQLKVTVLNRRRDVDGAASALAEARGSVGNVPPLPGLAAMLAAEHGSAREADAAFEGLDVTGDPGLATYWIRHLLRHGEPGRAAAFGEAAPASFSRALRPYLSLAYRALGDPRGAWLAGERFVDVVDLGTDWPLLDPLIEAVRRLHVTSNEPLDQSVRGGTQTDGPLLWRTNPAIQAARAALQSIVAGYVQKLPRDEPHPFVSEAPKHPRIAGSWSVRLTEGGYHDPHIHGDGWLSSAFYLVVPPPGSDGAGWLTLGAPQAELGLDMAPLRMVEPKPGRLVLFPSTMWHGTRPFAGAERLTLAFDIA